jgi:hypothetical protein
MKALTFHHKFSNGEEVEIRVTRKPNHSAKIESSRQKQDFVAGVEREYLAWLDYVAAQVFEESSEVEREMDFLEGLARFCGNA